MADHYLLLKSLHILGAMLFVGNIMVTALWKLMADRSRAAGIIAYAQRMVTVTDFAFTSVGAGLLVATGWTMGQSQGGVTEVYWIRMGWYLFLASVLLWGLVLIPVQVMQAQMARRFQLGGAIPERYWGLARIWYVFGAVAVALPLANLYFMVFKPTTG
ncbi:MAG TPA: DUF2269 family protein [Chromatiales bacterium]|nr:DUF2269 family protein [Chromatiales bacterium]